MNLSSTATRVGIAAAAVGSVVAPALATTTAATPAFAGSGNNCSNVFQSPQTCFAFDINGRHINRLSSYMQETAGLGYSGTIRLGVWIHYEDGSNSKTFWGPFKNVSCNQGLCDSNPSFFPERWYTNTDITNNNAGSPANAMYSVAQRQDGSLQTDIVGIPIPN